MTVLRNRRPPHDAPWLHGPSLKITHPAILGSPSSSAFVHPLAVFSSSRYSGKLGENLLPKTPYKFKKSYGGTPEPQTPQDAPWLRGPSLKILNLAY